MGFVFDILSESLVINKIYFQWNEGIGLHDSYRDLCSQRIPFHYHLGHAIPFMSQRIPLKFPLGETDNIFHALLVSFSDPRSQSTFPVSHL